MSRLLSLRALPVLALEEGGDPRLEVEGDLPLHLDKDRLLDEDRLQDGDPLPHSEDQEDPDQDLEEEAAMVVPGLTSPMPVSAARTWPLCITRR